MERTLLCLVTFLALVACEKEEAADVTVLYGTHCAGCTVSYGLDDSVIAENVQIDAVNNTQVPFTATVVAKAGQVAWITATSTRESTGSTMAFLRFDDEPNGLEYIRPDSVSDAVRPSVTVRSEITVR